jgi:DNA topoisomerase-1
MAFASTALLEKYFPDLVDLEFTANMENDLDGIASGTGSKAQYLHGFYKADGGFEQRIKVGEEDIVPAEARVVQLEDFPYEMRVGRFGPYVQLEEDGEKKTANVPEDVAPADLNEDHVKQQLEMANQGPLVLGQHPEHDVPVYLKRGPYGPYVQLGDAPIIDPNKKGPKPKKPKRCSIPKGESPDGVDLARALQLLSLPRTVGKHPDGKVVQTGLGRFGPYLKHGSDFRSLKTPGEMFSIELEAALEILAQPKRGRGGRVLKELGEHPASGEAVNIYEGRYGAYIKYGRKNITLPKGSDPEKFTMAEAVKLIAEKGVTAKKKSAKKKSAKKKSAKKKTAKKKAAKKKSTKKKSAKKKAAAKAQPAAAEAPSADA